MKNLISTIFVFNSIISNKCEKCIWTSFHPSNTIPTPPFPGQYVETRPYPNKDLACSYCSDIKRKDRSKSPFGFIYHLPGLVASCYTSEGSEYNVSTDSPYGYTYVHTVLPVYEQAIDLTNKTVEVGHTVVIETEYFEPVNGNDTNELYFLNEYFMQTENVSLLSFTKEHPETKAKIDYKSHRQIAVQDNQKRMAYTYRYKKMNFQFMDDGRESDSTVYSAVIHSNDAYFTIDFEQITVVHREKRQCVLNYSPSSNTYKMNDNNFRLNTKLETSEDCNRDLTNVHIFATFEDIFETVWLSIDDEKCMGEPDIQLTSKNAIYMKYNRFHMKAISCFKVFFKMASNISKPIISRYYHYSLLVRYNGFEDNETVSNTFQIPFKLFIPTQTFKKTFYLRSQTTGFYAQRSYLGYPRIYNEIITLFRMKPYDITDEEGISIQSTLSHYQNNFGNATNKKIDYSGDDIKIKNEELYLDSGSQIYSKVEFSSEVKTKAFKRFYYQSSKWTAKTEAEVTRQRALAYNITTIYVNQNANETFYMCINVLKAPCFAYDLETKNIKAMKTLMVELYAFYNDTLYGVSSTGSYLEHNIELKYEKGIQDTTYENLNDFTDVVLAINYTRYSITEDDKKKDIFTQHHNYSIRYYGLYNESTNDYVFLWPSSKGCHLTVAKDVNTSLASCKQIK